jgi:hypothetical protein
MGNPFTELVYYDIRQQKAQNTSRNPRWGVASAFAVPAGTVAVLTTLTGTGTDPFGACRSGRTSRPRWSGPGSRPALVADSASPSAQLPDQNPQFTGHYKQLMSTFRGEPSLQG